MRTSRLLAILPVLPAALLVAAAASCTALLGDFNGPAGSGGDGGPLGDSSLDGTTGDASDTGTADGGEAGGGEGGGPEGGGGGDGGQEGGTVSCALVASQQRVVTGGDGGTIAADNLFVYGASQTNVLALVKTGTDPSLAFAFRSDRPGDAPQTVDLAGASTPANLMSSARSVDNTRTYVLASDQSNNLLLWDWPDGMNLQGAPTSTVATVVQYQASRMTPTNTGLFFASAIQSQGVFVDYEMPPAAPQFAPSTQISTVVDTGLGDGQRTYHLSDDSVMLLYFANDGTLHQSN